MKRILLVISNLEYGGAQRQVVELANHLDPTRFDAHVACLWGYVPLADRLSGRENRLHIVRKYHKFDFTVVPRLALLLRCLKTEVVHGFLFDAEIAARLGGWLARTPLIIGSERNTDYDMKRRQRIAYGLTRRCVHGMVANSRAGAAWNARVLGMDPAIYRVVYNGVDTHRFRPRPEERQHILEGIGLPPDDRVVGMFASFKKQKNHPLFFAAARRVLNELPEARFLLVGDMLAGGLHGSDRYKEQVNKLVDDLGIRHRCLFIGNRDDVERFYGACDLTVLPSLFEGTANVLLESMASGVPVVATDVSDNAYLVPDGRCGYLVPLGDEAALAERIVRLLREDDERRRMGDEAREWVCGEFSIPRFVAKVQAVYEELLAGKPSPTARA